MRVGHGLTVGHFLDELWPQITLKSRGADGRLFTDLGSGTWQRVNPLELRSRPMRALFKMTTIETRSAPLVALWIRVGIWFWHMHVSHKLALVHSDMGALEDMPFKVGVAQIGQAIDAWHGRAEWPATIHETESEREGEGEREREAVANSVGKPLTSRQQKRYPDLV